MTTPSQVAQRAAQKIAAHLNHTTPLTCGEPLVNALAAIIDAEIAAAPPSVDADLAAQLRDVLQQGFMIGHSHGPSNDYQVQLKFKTLEESQHAHTLLLAISDPNSQESLVRQGLLTIAAAKVVGDWCDDCRGYTHRPDCPSAPLLTEEESQLVIGAIPLEALPDAKVVVGEAERRPLPSAADLLGSDPDFTGDESTDEYMRRIRGRTVPFPPAPAEGEPVFGWITGNNMRVRGFYNGKKGARGENWYTDETGDGWSQLDVEFKPDPSVAFAVTPTAPAEGISLEEAVKRMRDVLEPFAKASYVFDQFDDEGMWAKNITIGELRAARAVFNSLPQDAIG